MSLRPKWQNIRKRDWKELRDAWLASVPDFQGIGTRPDPGLERLAPLLEITRPGKSDPPLQIPDVDGVRPNALWEAVFLFHKCAHANLAAQRLGARGMVSWCLFNAYHSAYLGARGITALLGVALPNLAGGQVAIDLFSEPPKQKIKLHAKLSPAIGSKFQHLLVIGLPLLEQRYLWEIFQRILRITEADCWDISVKEDLLELPFEQITPPRNHFLYKAPFWPLDDMTADDSTARMDSLFGTELAVDDSGFLLRLCYSVYRIFEQLMDDLGSVSTVVKEQIEGSRCRSTPGTSEISSYNSFLSQITFQGADTAKAEEGGL